MTNKEIIQISFEKGMVENVKQETFSVDGILESVLLLENYDPNIEYKAVILRKGERPIYEEDNPNVIGKNSIGK